MKSLPFLFQTIRKKRIIARTIKVTLSRETKKLIKRAINSWISCLESVIDRDVIEIH